MIRQPPLCPQGRSSEPGPGRLTQRSRPSWPLTPALRPGWPNTLPGLPWSVRRNMEVEKVQECERAARWTYSGRASGSLASEESFHTCLFFTYETQSNETHKISNQSCRKKQGFAIACREKNNLSLAMVNTLPLPLHPSRHPSPSIPPPEVKFKTALDFIQASGDPKKTHLEWKCHFRLKV